MKTGRLSVVGSVLIGLVCFMLTAADVVAAPKDFADKETAMEMDRIMQGFYLDPRPEKVTAFLKLLSGFNEDRVWQTQPCNCVFLGEIFARYSTHLSQWLKIKGHRGYRETVAHALLYADCPGAKIAYCQLTGTDVKKIPPTPPDVSATELDYCTPSTLDSCWGGFFASGKEKYLDLVIAMALRPISADKIDMTQRAALWSLLGLGEKHPAVDEYFRKKLQKAYPRDQYSLAKQISEKRQLELLGRILISDAEKDKDDPPETKKTRQTPVTVETRLTPEFFASLPLTNRSYQSDYLKRASGFVRQDVKHNFPDLPEKEVEKLVWDHLLLKDMRLPRKLSDTQASFLRFYAMCIYMANNVANARQKKMLLDSGLEIAQAHADDLTVAQMVFRGLQPTNAIAYLTPELLQEFRLHPYLELLLQGEQARLQAWKHRGGGYADTVSTHGWQSFRENMQRAGKFFAEAWQKYSTAPEAPAMMLEVVGCGCGDDEEMLVWFKRALCAQIDYSGSIKTFTWYSRPRWGGSTAQLLADAKAFFRQREKDAKLAQNGIYLLQAFLSEIPYIDDVRFFAGAQNYEELKDLFGRLAKNAQLDSSQKLFFGTVAFLADDRRTADKIIASLTPEDRAFARRMTGGSIPQLYWVDFPALPQTLNRVEIRGRVLSALQYQNVDAVASLLKKTIPTVADPADKQVLIDLYIALKGGFDWLTFRSRMPMFIWLCADSEHKIDLIKTAIALGTDVNVVSPKGTRRPLFYAMRDEKSGELLEILIAAGVDPNAMWGDHTPLDYSCRYQFPPARIRRLLEVGADPNKKYLKSFSALHASINNLEATKLLVEFGAKLNEVSKFGHTPLDLAEKMGSVEVAKFLRSKGAKHASEL